MTFIVKEANDILTQVLRKLQTDTSLTATGPGSVLRSMAEAITTELGDFYNILDFNMAMQVITTASGRALDLLGSLYNVQRKTVSNLAVIDRSLGSFYFYVDSPAPSDILIPSGVKIFTNNTDFIGNLFTYQTVDVAIIPAGRLRAYVTIVPIYADSIYTAGIGTLVSHDFTGGPVGVVIKCTNVKSISPQTAAEDDDNYRARIIKSVRTTAGGTADSVRFAGLAVSGIRDITVLETPFGLGTFDVIVVTDDSTILVPTLSAVQDAVNAVRPVGVRMVLRAPDLLPISIKASILLRNDPNTAAEAIASRARIAILRYLNTMLVGTTLIYTNLIQSILDSSETILDVSITEFSANGVEVLRKNYVPNTDQQIIPGEIVVIASV